MSTVDHRALDTHLEKILSTAFTEYRQSLLRRAFYKTHDAMLSEDLVQTTFLKTWKYLVNGGRVDLMKAFLNHVLNGLIIDEYRKKKPVSLDALLTTGFEPTINDIKRIANVNDGRSALRLINRLPKKYENVIRMRYVYDLSLEEMAAITGQTKNTMSVQAHRGLEKLKELYEHK